MPRLSGAPKVEVSIQGRTVLESDNSCADCLRAFRTSASVNAMTPTADADITPMKIQKSPMNMAISVEAIHSQRMGFDVIAITGQCDKGQRRDDGALPVTISWTSVVVTENTSRLHETRLFTIATF